MHIIDNELLACALIVEAIFPNLPDFSLEYPLVLFSIMCVSLIVFL